VNTKQQFREILDKFDTAMLVTSTSDGSLRARPMFIAQKEKDGELWFITSMETEKVDEILEDAHAAVTMQSPSRYMAISGHATVVRNRQLVDKLWKPILRAWFENKNDANVALIRFLPEEAEYWDESGMRGVKYMLKAVKAAVTGGNLEPEDLDEQHGRVQL
jgi:general stress protein 26